MTNPEEPSTAPSSPVAARTLPALWERLRADLSAVLKGLGGPGDGHGGNPNHDAKGRFASHAASATAKPPLLVGGALHPLDPKTLVGFRADTALPEHFPGPKLEPWTPGRDWHENTKDLIKPDLVEPPLDLGKGWAGKDGQQYTKHAGAGVLVTEADGRVWVVAPKGEYGGYKNTFPKGTQDEGLSLQETAVKEAWEESGLKVKITGLAGDWERSTSVARYYTAVRVGGDPRDFGPETAAVKLVPPSQLKDVMNKEIDRHISKLFDPTIDVTPPKPTYAHTYTPSSHGGAKPKAGDPGTSKYSDNPWNKAASGKSPAWTSYASVKAADAKAKEAAKAGEQAPSSPGEPAAPTIQATPALPPVPHAYDPHLVPVAAKTADATTILAQKIGGQGGSNPGGVFKGSDGVKRYVKFYSDPAQAHGEHLANQVYRALGLGAPESQTFEHAGKTAYASRMMEGGVSTLGQLGVTPGRAHNILDGFAADVLVGNWDAVGTGHDNIVYHGKVDAAKPIRVDNGGAFLHRAQNGRKPDQFLNAISEYAGLAAPTVNPYYAKLFQAVGHTPDTLPGFKAQVAKIDDVEKQAGGWASFVQQHAPGLSATDRPKVVKMLESRHALLREKAAKHV